MLNLTKRRLLLVLRCTAIGLSFLNCGLKQGCATDYVNFDDLVQQELAQLHDVKRVLTENFLYIILNNDINNNLNGIVAAAAQAGITLNEDIILNVCKRLNYTYNNVLRDRSLGADKRAEISLVAGFIHALMYFSFDYADVFAKIMNSSGHNIDSAFEAVFNAVPEVVAKKAARSAAADD